MKKYTFWINAFLLTFLLGVGVVISWFTLNDADLKAAVPPVPLLLNENCVDPAHFPALAQKISALRKSKSGYFPKEIFSDEKWKEQDDFINDWYGKHLKAMGEKSLLDVSNEKTEVYRFLWLRSFHHPIFVRIERNQNKIKLFTKELNGAGGYEPREVLRNFSRDLTEAEWCNFLKSLRKLNFWKLPTNRRDMTGLDGAQWLLEGVKNERYHVVDRWTPDDTDYRETCIYLLQLSGIDTDKLGDDLY